MTNCGLTTKDMDEVSEYEREQEVIATFFNDKVPSIVSVDSFKVAPTQSDCHKFASDLLRCTDIKPIKSQGSFSYTVFSSQCQKVVQFRLERLDESILSLASETYGDLVPVATLAPNFSLPVYVSPLVHGHLHHCEPYPETSATLKRQTRTVRELAEFIAKGASTLQAKLVYSPDSWTLTAESALHKLIANRSLAKIEPGFAARAKSLLPRVHLLKELPAALCHTDFFENNIMVEPGTGKLTGILDWDGAQLEAFGMMIYGVYDSFFGYMTGHSGDAVWSRFGTVLPDPDDQGNMRSVRDILESNFWDAFWNAVPLWFGRAQYEDAIQVAIEVGFVQRNLRRWLVDEDGRDEDGGDREAPGELQDVPESIRQMRGVWLGK